MKKVARGLISSRRLRRGSIVSRYGLNCATGELPFVLLLVSDVGSFDEKISRTGESPFFFLFPGVAPSADLGPAEVDLAISDPGIRSFSVDKPFIPEGDPITLHWEVNPNATSIIIDNGVGDVTSLTDAAGVGSITLNPGPSADVTYRMIAFRPAGNSAASLLVTVTDQPIIFSLEANRDPVKL